MCRTKGLSFFSDGEPFAADVTRVQKIARKVEVTPVPASPGEVVGIAGMKGKVVTILSVAALLGKRREARGLRGMQTVNAIIFKPFQDDTDQMGLVMDRPGDLIEIQEDRISPLPLAEGGTPGRTHISGVIEVDGILYRIIDMDSIIDRFKEECGYRAAPGPQGGLTHEII